MAALGAGVNWMRVLSDTKLIDNFALPDTHASKSLCPSPLTCSHRSRDALPPEFPHSAGMVPGQGLM